MRVLYACRLFTGLERSLFLRVWAPTGVPTICRIVETLDRDAEEFQLILTAKGRSESNYTAWQETGNLKLIITGLKHPVLVLGVNRCLPKILGRFTNHVRELAQSWRIWREIACFKPDLVYFDHANIWTAGVVARFLRIPVVLRIMGVYPAMIEALSGKRGVHRLLRWLYRSPYDLVICTQDGSNTREWLRNALAPSVRREIAINGVDRTDRPVEVDPRLEMLPKDRTLVLFVGKLEHYKGCEQFVEAMLSLFPRLGDQLHSVIIGVGNLREQLQARVASAGATEIFTFIDRLPHEQVVEAHARSDIYVSLNLYGNLSNANLEAMIAGDCMIIPESDRVGGYDLVTDDLLPRDTVWRVPRSNLVTGLTKAIEYLNVHPEKRALCRRRIRETASRFIPTWEERVAWELRLLEEVCRGRGRSGKGHVA